MERILERVGELAGPGIPHTGDGAVFPGGQESLAVAREDERLAPGGLLREAADLAPGPRVPQGDAGAVGGREELAVGRVRDGLQIVLVTQSHRAEAQPRASRQ